VAAMTRQSAGRSRTIYAVVVSLYCLFLLAAGVWLFPVQTHGGPLGLMFLMLGILFVPLAILLWRGKVWAGVVALLISFYPGVWPFLWNEIAGCAQPLSRWLSEGVALSVVWSQFFACLRRPLSSMSWVHAVMLAAPAVFAALTVICLAGRTRAKPAADA
jgi:hypothetical protein